MIVDLIEADSVSNDIVRQAMRQAFARGLINRKTSEGCPDSTYGPKALRGRAETDLPMKPAKKYALEDRLRLATPITDLDAAPYGGARYPVECRVDGRIFARFSPRRS